MIKTYSEMMKYRTYEDRLKYLKLDGEVSELTFGHNRYLNQDFYHSNEWKRFRRSIIIRDNGCDLACPDREIRAEHILIHHLNPITVDDILSGNHCIVDPENVICVTHNTHNAIHYGDISKVEILQYKERKPNDTCLWR